MTKNLLRPPKQDKFDPAKGLKQQLTAGLHQGQGAFPQARILLLREGLQQLTAILIIIIASGCYYFYQFVQLSADFWPVMPPWQTANQAGERPRHLGAPHAAPVQR